MIDLVIYFIIYYLIICSILGFGTLLNFNKETEVGLNFNKETEVGFLGFKGLFVLIILSYITNFFFKHGYIHNIIILVFGISFFIINFKKIYFNNQKIIYFSILLYSILFIGILIYKNHDDFFYYHFGYTLSLVNFEKIIGIGNLEHGCRTPSSIFYLNSLFYLPFVKYFMMHSGVVYFMGFANIFLIEKIYEIRTQKSNKEPFLLFLITFSFIFINTIFYRLAEHGTDRSALILIFLIVIIFIDKINYKHVLDFKKLNQYNEKILILFFLIISLKSFYLIYLLLLFYWIFDNRKIFFKAENLFGIITNKITILFILGLFLVLLTNFLNTGCIIYPASFTCFENFSWSINKIEVEKMKSWYELWSKAGASPDYIVGDPSDYLRNFNWISNWFTNYFFNKVSDFLLALVFLCIIFLFLFYGREKKKNKTKFLTLYFLIFILFLEWFINHPALRYGGYTLVALIIFLPICSVLNQNCRTKNLFKKITFLIVLSLIIFVAKNINRIINEKNKYDYKIIKSPFYKLDESAFFYDKKLKYLYKINNNNNKLIITKELLENKL